MILSVYLAIIFILFIFIFWEISCIISLIFGSPFTKTPRDYLKKAFKIADLKPNEIVYDLGSGDGSVLIVAAKDFKAKATGYEISPWRYLLSKSNLRRNHIRSANIVFQDFKKADLNKADVIYMYVMPKLIKKLKNKIINLRKGMRIISYRFPINYLKLFKHEGKIYVYKI